jgi:hypothetical protein
MSPAGLEPTIPASEQPQTHPLDRAATGIGSVDIPLPMWAHMLHYEFKKKSQLCTVNLMNRAADGVSERADQPHRYFSFYTTEVTTFAPSLDCVLSPHSPTPPTALPLPLVK